jgi:hypothetical protein
MTQWLRELADWLQIVAAMSRRQSSAQLPAKTPETVVLSISGEVL